MSGSVELTAGGSPLAHDVLGAGHPFVLIHADSLDRRFWDFQLDAFSSRFRVVRYDLRNHGRSPRFSGWYDGDRDLAGLLDTLSIGAAHLLGTGSGANIALEFALNHSHRVTALVLVGGAFTGNFPGPGEWSELFGKLAPTIGAFITAQQSGDPGPLVDGLLAARQYSSRNEAGRELLRRMMIDNAHLLTQPLGAFPKPISPAAVNRLAEIRVPALIMVGEHDWEFVKRDADSLQQAIPGATKVIIAGAGIYPNLDDPGAFNAAVLDFLSAAGTGDGQ
ncbi:MAG: alpha/beta fold hydrolase [Actinobacteria bacterium]|nr:alpha/beta fold hydrolase [Actinomycetota bacterium]